MVLNIKRASSLDEATANLQEVLKPFIHQVGGHTPFTSLSNGHLLKPCVERELYFYQFMPDILKFISPLCCTTIQGGSVNNLKDCCAECRSHQLENLIIPESIEGSPILNKRKLSKNFIVISDLTHKMKSPRILDLKLGTRQHGDHATSAKIACMMAKCQKTTSATLGVRLCGMKYQDQESRQSVTINKYDGREMTEVMLYQAIHDFFNVSPMIVKETLKRIKIIRETLCKVDGIRLFGASLLIVIEGDEGSLHQQPIENLVRIKIVDFANATFKGFLDDEIFYSGIDEGSILGLDTIQQFLCS